jgi:RNA polymerase sigma-70 factor (ECF subfamily)
MEHTEVTCWTVIRGAARGNEDDVERFVHLYAPIVHAYLSGRWRSSPAHEFIEDAAQEVFVECFKKGGVLDQADHDRLGSFRAFLVGVVRNVALRYETRKLPVKEVQAESGFEPEDPKAKEERLSRVFDRAWAEAVVREAGVRQDERARILGAEARRRVELLRLRFHDGLRIREIAARWNLEPRVVHKEYARARKEFEEALREVMHVHHPRRSSGAENEIDQLLELLA